MFPINSAHWHLVLNHLPILGSFLGVFLIIYVYLRGSTEWETVALWWFVVIALLAIPVYLTGEPAEELVEGMPGVSHDAAEHHEYWAMWGFTLQEITGVYALGVLLYRHYQQSIGNWVRHTFLGLILVTAALMGYTATLGGHIHHPETRPGFTPPEEHEGEKEHGEKSVRKEHEKKTNSVHSSPGSVDLDPKFMQMLRKEMRHLESGMNQLLTHLVRGRREKTARTATRIHESFILKQELSNEELKHLQKQLPEEFVQLDQAFHKSSAKLAEAARNGQMDEAMEQYKQMSSDCVTCHTRYARNRFTGLSSPRENENK